MHTATDSTCIRPPAVVSLFYPGTLASRLPISCSSGSTHLLH